MIGEGGTFNESHFQDTGFPVDQDAFTFQGPVCHFGYQISNGDLPLADQSMYQDPFQYYPDIHFFPTDVSLSPSRSVTSETSLVSSLEGLDDHVDLQQYEKNIFRHLLHIANCYLEPTSILSHRVYHKTPLKQT